jgi:hypothetical protein
LGKSALSCSLSQDRKRRGVILWDGERLKVRDEQSDVFECRLLVLFEEETKPAGGEASVAVRLLAGDQGRQLERLGDRHPADLPRGHLGKDEVVAFQRPAEDRSRLPLRSRRCSSPGPSGVASLRLTKRPRARA